MSGFAPPFLPLIAIVQSAIAANAYGDDLGLDRTFLHSDELESSCKLSAKAEAISLPGFDDSNGPRHRPRTSSALVADKTPPIPTTARI